MKDNDQPPEPSRLRRVLSSWGFIPAHTRFFIVKQVDNAIYFTTQLRKQSKLAKISIRSLDKDAIEVYYNMWLKGLQLTVFAN